MLSKIKKYIVQRQWAIGPPTAPCKKTLELYLLILDDSSLLLYIQIGKYIITTSSNLRSSSNKFIIVFFLLHPSYRCCLHSLTVKVVLLLYFFICLYIHRKSFQKTWISHVSNYSFVWCVWFSIMKIMKYWWILGFCVFQQLSLLIYSIIITGIKMIVATFLVLVQLESKVGQHR